MCLTKLLARYIVFCALTVGLFTPNLAQAYIGITIVMSAPSKINLDFIVSFKEVLIASNNIALKVNVIDLVETEKLTVAENSELVIALGIKALTAASKLRHTTPVLGVFTPLPTFNYLLESSGRKLGIFSAIVLEQPHRRQMALMKAIYPKADSVGILLGPNSQIYQDYLKADGPKYFKNVNIEKVNSDIQLMPKLRKLFDSNDALLAIPDPVIYNRETAQQILLTSYLYGKPIFGYSQSYVRAGALASVYSSARQLAKQAAEIAIASKDEAIPLPPARAPKYFSVKVNYQVANSLNILLADEMEIYEKIKQQKTAIQ